jgi:hypothetical protein
MVNFVNPEQSLCNSLNITQINNTQYNGYLMRPKGSVSINNTVDVNDHELAPFTI